MLNMYVIVSVDVHESESEEFVSHWVLQNFLLAKYHPHCMKLAVQFKSKLGMVQVKATNRVGAEFKTQRTKVLKNERLFNTLIK